MATPLRIFISSLLIIASFGITGCNETKDLEELFDLVTEKPERKPIDTSRMGVNSFFVAPGLGTISERYVEIRDTLRLNYVRVLFAWTDGVQPSPGSSLNFSFYDDIIEAIPPGVDVLIVLSHTPGWMVDPANWIDGNARKTWVEKFLRPMVERYADTPGIIGWEVFNEPDLITVASDASLELIEPSNYFELLGFASEVLRTTDPTRLIVMAATSSIQQNYSSHLDYNKELKELGTENLIDIWNIHYYGEQFENVVRNGGVESFLDSLSVPIWITESGEQGPNNQLPYVETAWPYLREKVPGIDRIYYYQFAETGSPETSFGLKTVDSGTTLSDLYIFLRDR